MFIRGTQSYGIYAVHQVKCVHNDLQKKGLNFHSEENNKKSYFSFISKANLHSFLKWAVLAILLPEGMPDLCFPQIYYVFWKRYLTLHAVAEYE